MIPSDMPIFLALEPIDLRWSFDILAGLVRDRLGGDPKDGALFLFFGRRRDRVKVLFYDHTGYCLLYKRLDRGTFRLPEVAEPGGATLCIDEQELALLLHGIELPAEGDKRSSRSRRRLH